MGTIHYFANGGKAFPKERIEVFADDAVLQLDNFKVLKGYGWKGFRSKRLLAEVALEGSHPDAREAALERLKDPTVIAAIAKQDSSSRVRGKAVRRIDDQELLVDVAVTDTSWRVRSDVMRQMSLAGQKDVDGPMFKLDEDPRITMVGRFLRRTSPDGPDLE